MPLAVLFEDADMLVIDKPPGLVVHPAAGHWSGTLLNGLLAYAPELADVPRAGIVHRLDAGTSGLMVVARTLAAQADLVRQLQARTVRREYWAIVLGEPRRHGTVDAPIGRDPRNPLRFKVSHASSARSARTQYWNLASVRQGNATLSWLACRLDTGRTHQIRVHLEHLGHPLVGDPVYRRRLPSPDADGCMACLRPTGAACMPPRARAPAHAGADAVVSCTAGRPGRADAVAGVRADGPACRVSGRRMTSSDWIRPDWPVPPGVKAIITTRAGGSSTGAVRCAGGAAA